LAKGTSKASELIFKTQDMQQGIKAFMEKREPKFQGR
jgi:1,4-dihydroxy-2-naphthoyl-CoA synthase